MAWVYANGTWMEGNPPVLGLMDNASWMASVVFDGARAFDGLAPDLDRHCARAIVSARALLLDPPIDAAALTALCRDGIGRFAPGTALYVRPMFFATEGFIVPEPASTKLAVVVHELPMPEPNGANVTFSRYRRPGPDMAPTDAKASCLYPIQQRALKEARAKGFANAISLDGQGNVAELATANLWIVRDGVALTPAPNGTFLNGITRQRVMALLRADGIEVVEATLSPKDVLDADEAFSTGNWGKVLPITAVEERTKPIGPIYKRARALYMDFASDCRA